MEKTVAITLSQAKTALECIKSDIEMSRHSETDFLDINALRFYLERAEVAQRLENAIKAVSA
jgi:hypothetical protein